MDVKILEELDLLVSDHQQIVSYKWLSRNLCVTSNAAKRLLEDYVRHRKEKETPLEVLHTVSGWNNDTPSTYFIQLAQSSKLSATILLILLSLLQNLLFTSLMMTFRYSAVECTSISRILTNDRNPHPQPEAKVAPPREQPPKVPEITRQQPESKIDEEETSEIPEKRKIPGSNSSKGQSLSSMWQKTSIRQPEKPRVNASKAVMIATADNAFNEFEEGNQKVTTMLLSLPPLGPV